MPSTRGTVCSVARHDRGFAMAALLVAIAVLTISWSVALPVWTRQAQREKETELIFRGEQYARAINKYQQTYANAYPPSLEVLIEQKFLRQLYADPMVEDGEFQLLYPTAGAGIMGLAGRARGSGRGGGISGLGPGQGGRIGGLQRGRGAGVPGQVATDIIGSLSFTTNPERAGAGVAGVVSRSHQESIRVYQDKTHYDEWQFTPQTVAIGAAAATLTPTATPGALPGREGGPAVPITGRRGAPPPGRR